MRYYHILGTAQCRILVNLHLDNELIVRARFKGGGGTSEVDPGPPQIRNTCRTHILTEIFASQKSRKFCLHF
jgi:hypothetical protein